MTIESSLGLHSATGFLGRNGLPHIRSVPGKVHPQSQNQV